ncbi:hypothetical protein DYB32_008123 [Aphanomyces invadans]|uniref:Uncharacterized protein n=1 Tax=Aphanomyces invadans TaxID=157072 RepID=A0A3R6V687_9STRA|nr:hypothetical protein DYB32_008123 [Aphanomyces invadans]
MIDAVVVVKDRRKGMYQVLSTLLSPSVQQKTSLVFNLVTPVIGRIIGGIVLFLVFVDAIANNWAIVDFCGNALHFRTPVANVKTAAELSTEYIFGQGRGFGNLSNVGQWMIGMSIEELATVSADVYFLTAGAYAIMDSTNFCGGFNGNYSVPDLAMPVKLAVVDDGVTYIRGNSLTHAFTNDLTENLPTKDAKMADLVALGFHPARMQTDMKMTTSVDIKNKSSSQNFAIPWYRVYSKSFCTGCTPLTALSHGICNITVKYVDATKTAVVSKSFSAPNSTHYLGLMFRRSIYSTIGAVLKYIAIFIAVAGYLAGRKTIQWHERVPENVETVAGKLVDMVFPKYYPHLSHAIRFDLFCYNSDVFVLLFVVSNVLDMNQAIQYIREVNQYNVVSPDFSMSLQLLALSTRLLWLNVGMVKVAKMAVHLLSLATYCGQSRVMKYLNFSSVSTLYISAILLFYVPDYIEYNNDSRWDIRHSFENINGCYINYFSSFYFRTAPAIGIGLALNVAGVLVVDHIVLFRFWHYLAKNSLGRQVMFNTSCVTCEFVSDFTVEADDSSVIQCKVRRLSTLQWYLMNQTLCFGLLEKELSKKKHARAPGATHPSTVSVAKQDDTVGGTGKDIFHVISQSDSGHIHLLDDQLVEVKSLALNIKILRDTDVFIR